MKYHLYFLLIIALIISCVADETVVSSGGSTLGWISSLKDQFLSFMKPNIPTISTGESALPPQTPPSSSSSSSSSSLISTELESPSGNSIVVYDVEIEKLINSRIEAAQSVIRGGDFEKGLDLLIEILGEYPDHQRINSLTGALLLSIEQFDVAEDILYHAVRVSNWTDPIAVINLSMVLKLRGEPQLALKTLTKGYLINNSTDENGAFSYQFAELFRNVSNYDKAREWYFSAALKMETDEEMWLQASTLFFPSDHRDIKIAENVLLEGVSRNRNSSELIFYLGYVMYSTDRVDEAITFFEQSVRLNGDNNQAISGLATAFHAKKDYNTAFQYYNVFLKRKPDSPAVLANFAALLQEMNRIPDAEKVLSRAYDLDPNDPVVIRIMKQLNAVPATSP